MIDWDKKVTAAENQAKVDEEARNVAKADRQEQTRNIRVTTATGNVFQGDEVSQGRMTHVLQAYAAELPDGTVEWILADNTVATVTMSELDEALRLSVDAQNAIWMDYVAKAPQKPGEPQ